MDSRSVNSIVNLSLRFCLCLCLYKLMCLILYLFLRFCLCCFLRVNVSVSRHQAKSLCSCIRACVSLSLCLSVFVALCLSVIYRLSSSVPCVSTKRLSEALKLQRLVDARWTQLSSIDFTCADACVFDEWACGSLFSVAISLQEWRSNSIHCDVKKSHE